MLYVKFPENKYYHKDNSKYEKDKDVSSLPSIGSITSDALIQISI
jgi:hypothetical protein